MFVSYRQDGYPTTVWGPVLWFLLHLISVYSSRDVDPLHYFHTLEYLQYVLPCKVCRVNYTKNIVPRLNIQDIQYQLPLFIYELHCIVNSEQSKCSAPPEKMLQLFYWLKSNCKTSDLGITIEPSPSQRTGPSRYTVFPSDKRLYPIKHYWTPVLWFPIHCIAFNFPVHSTDTVYHKDWLLHLSYILPSVQYGQKNA